MNLHQLSVFRAVVETGTFSKAAAQQHLAQSAVSYHIKALEGEIGKPLLVRGKNRITLTEKGVKLWEHVEKIFHAVDQAQRELCEALPGESGELHFGLGVSSLSEQLPGFARELRELCPAVCFHVMMGSTPMVVSHLLANSLELGIVSLPVSECEISIIPLFHEREEMLVVLGQDHALAERPDLSPAEIKGLPLILYHKGTATRANLDAFFSEVPLTPLIFMEVDREDTIVHLVRSGLGGSILPRCVFGNRPEPDGIRLLRLRDAYLRREVGIAVPKHVARSKLAEAAIVLCRKHFRGSESGIQNAHFTHTNS